jgi:serine protease Do
MPGHPGTTFRNRRTVARNLVLACVLVLPAAAAPAEQNNPGPAGFADIVEAVKPSVIGVRANVATGENAQPGSESPFDQFFRGRGRERGGREHPGERNILTRQGSGFFISADGYAVTNTHVVEGSDTAEVRTDDGKVHAAKVVGTDPVSDLALIKVDGGDGFAYATLADQVPRVGDWLLAIGNPFGLGGSVTAGIVSARGRDIGVSSYDDLIQIDASVNQGDSGGPSFGLDGKVIGINTMVVAPGGASTGIAFAIPADTVKVVISQLKEKGSVTRGWIGVQIQPITPDVAESLGLENVKGALVTEPQADGPAAKAGIASGDVIASLDNVPIKDAHDLAKKVGAMAPGATVNLDVLRKGEKRTVSLVLGELPVKREGRP